MSDLFYSWVKHDKLYKSLLLLIILLAIAFRAIFFSYQRPFWNDECALIDYMINYSNFFIDNSSQVAPALFMYISKLLYYILPIKEFGLRVLPFVASIFSIFMFYMLAEKWLNRKFSVIVSMGLFSFVYPLIYYAQEFKQYSSDVCVILALLMSYFVISNKPSLKKLICLGIFYSISVWISFPSVYALISICVTLIIFKNFQFKNLFFPIILPVFLNVIIFYLFNCTLNNNTYLHEYWQEGFINKGVLDFVKLMFSNSVYFFSSALPLFFIIASIIAVLVKDRKNPIFYLIIIPLLLSFIISALEIYPFLNRVILYLIPIFILLTVKIFDYIPNNFLNTVLAMVIIAPAFIFSVDKVLFKNYVSEDIKTPLNIAIQNAGEDDIFIIADSGEILYSYYGKLFDIKNSVIVEKERFTDENLYIENLESYEKGKTYYWIFAHHPKKFERVNSVYSWAKDKPNFSIYADKKGNALIRYTLR